MLLNLIYGMDWSLRPLLSLSFACETIFNKNCIVKKLTNNFKLVKALADISPFSGHIR